MKKKSCAVVLALLLTAGAAAGCGTDSSDGGADRQNTESRTDAESTDGSGSSSDGEDAAGNGTSSDGEDTAGNGISSDGEDAAGNGTLSDGEVSADDSGENSDTESSAGGDRTEVRREDYPDCDGSGHGYVEIYYSDGTMETEEY